MPIHVNMLELIQYGIAIDNLILFDYLLLYFALILAIIRRVYYVLQLTIIANLQPTDLLPVQPNVHAVNLLHQLNGHLLVTHTALLLVARYLNKCQMPVNALVVNVYPTFDVRFDLHFDFEDVVLLQDLLLCFKFLLLLWWCAGDVNLPFIVVWVLHGHFMQGRIVALINLVLLVDLLALLKHVDDLGLVQVAEEVDAHLWICALHLCDIEKV